MVSYGGSYVDLLRQVVDELGRMTAAEGPVGPAGPPGPPGLPSAIGPNGQSCTLRALALDAPIPDAVALWDTPLLIPAGVTVISVSAQVLVAIPGVATFTVGVPGANARYSNALMNSVGVFDPGLKDGSRLYTAATPVRVDPNVATTAAGGIVRLTIFYWEVLP